MPRLVHTPLAHPKTQNTGVIYLHRYLAWPHSPLPRPCAVLQVHNGGQKDQFVFFFALICAVILNALQLYTLQIYRVMCVTQMELILALTLRVARTLTLGPPSPPLSPVALPSPPLPLPFPLPPLPISPIRLYHPHPHTTPTLPLPLPPPLSPRYLSDCKREQELTGTVAAEAEGLRLHLSSCSFTGYKGVRKDVRKERPGRFEAYLARLDGRQVGLGTFGTAVEAAVAYARAVGEAPEAPVEEQQA